MNRANEYQLAGESEKADEMFESGFAAVVVGGAIAAAEIAIAQTAVGAYLWVVGNPEGVAVGSQVALEVAMGDASPNQVAGGLDDALRLADDAAEFVGDALSTGSKLDNAVSQTGRHASCHPSASNAAELERLRRQLTSDAQFAEVVPGNGTPIFGAGTGTTLNDAESLAERSGGDPGGWSKMGGTSSSHYGTSQSDGTNFEIHWYENVETGQIVEPKTKIRDE